MRGVMRLRKARSYPSPSLQNKLILLYKMLWPQPPWLTNTIISWSTRSPT